MQFERSTLVAFSDESGIHFAGRCYTANRDYLDYKTNKFHKEPTANKLVWEYYKTH